MKKFYYVYILANGKNGTLYIGVTNNLKGRIWEHKNGKNKGFTKKYNVVKLVHHEHFDDVAEAIDREKQLKKWNRDWKIALIEKENLGWIDLYDELEVD